MTQDPDVHPVHTPETFAAWLRTMMERRGYTGVGAQRRFAKDSGLSQATLSRTLRAEGAPDVRTLETLSQALRVPLPELLVRAGVIQQHDLDALRHVAPEPLTTEQAAAELGITSPEGIAAFDRTVRGLRATEPPTEQPHAPPQ
ncbi:helix-turn-helix domain-containing protein [Streptomyces sp. NPDC008265]|uniref:helix-turn-helix domain-containing protein n=1 Tax=Streptomyces sp. NPDC008265 TaxID=3364824 RepID=UPI0036E1E5DC